MENRPIFECIPGSIVLYEKEYEEDFYNLINDLQHQPNDDVDINYVRDDYDGDDDSLGSREAEYAAMDEKEIMIVTDDDIFKEGDTSDHEYGSNEIKEEKIYGESEVEEGSDNCGDEEGADFDEEEKQLQEGPE